MTRGTIDFQEGMCLGLRAGNMQVIGAKCYELRAWMFLGDFKALLEVKHSGKIQAKISPTRHTRRTRPTTE